MDEVQPVLLRLELEDEAVSKPILAPTVISIGRCFPPGVVLPSPYLTVLLVFLLG